MRKLCFRIRKKYFDAIVKGEKTVEYRRHSDYWLIRVCNLLADPETTFPINIGSDFVSMKVVAIGVFICGKRIHRRKIMRVALQKTPGDFSAQGKIDVDTKTCFAFHLGEAVNEQNKN